MVFKHVSQLLLGSILSLSLHSNLVAEEGVSLVGAEVGEWTMDFDAASKLSKEKNLPMMLNFTGSDWCGWCKLMDKNVFAGQPWQDFAKENVVMVTIDFPRDPLVVPKAYLERNNELKNKFGVQGYPTYVVLDSDGETTLAMLSAGQEKTPESFVEEFKNATKLSAANIKAYIEGNPEKADAFNAAVDNLKSAQGKLKAWIETKPLQTEANIKLYEEFLSKIVDADTKLKEFE